MMILIRVFLVSLHFYVGLSTSIVLHEAIFVEKFFSHKYFLEMEKYN
jgi:hypothetical protein